METNFEELVKGLYNSGMSINKITQHLHVDKRRVSKIINGNSLIKPTIEFERIGTFWSKVNKEAKNGCWEWVGHRDAKGYGEFWIFGDTYRTHRISYSLYQVHCLYAINAITLVVLIRIIYFLAQVVTI